MEQKRFTFVLDGQREGSNSGLQALFIADMQVVDINIRHDMTDDIFPAWS